jgi:hypothetical protein
MRKDVKQLIEYATDYNFHFENKTGSGHIRLRHKGGKTVILPTTPKSGNRWRQNTLALIHRIDKDKP